MNMKDNIKGTEYLILLCWRLGQLKELGLIDGGESQLTSNGFDIAMDLHEEGYRFTKAEAIACSSVLYYDSNVIDLLLSLQTKGYDKVKEELIILRNK